MRRLVLHIRLQREWWPIWQRPVGLILGISKMLRGRESQDPKVSQ
jgi:hypothetical protein